MDRASFELLVPAGSDAVGSLCMGREGEGGKQYLERVEGAAFITRVWLHLTSAGAMIIAWAASILIKTIINIIMHCHHARRVFRAKSLPGFKSLSHSPYTHRHSNHKASALSPAPALAPATPRSTLIPIGTRACKQADGFSGWKPAVLAICHSLSLAPANRCWQSTGCSENELARKDDKPMTSGSLIHSHPLTLPLSLAHSLSASPSLSLSHAYTRLLS